MSYTKYAVHKSYKTYFLCLCLFMLALMSKPMAVSLPFVLLILDWYPFGRIGSLRTLRTALLEKLPFVALSIVSSILTIFAQKAGDTITSMTALPLSTRLLVAAKALVAYLWKTVFPARLVPVYPYPRSVSLLSINYVLPLVALTVISAACIFATRKKRLWLSAWSYYVITLIPVLGIVQVGSQSMADRYMYLPCLGPFLILGLIAARIYERTYILDIRRPVSRRIGMVAAVAIMAFLSYTTVKQIGVWKNSLTLWNYVIEQEPMKVPIAYGNLGIALLKMGRANEAVAPLRVAVGLAPSYAEAQGNLGFALLKVGKIDEAIVSLRTAVGLAPSYAEARNNLCLAYKTEGLYKKAIDQCRAAIRLRPDYAEAHNNLGIAYKLEGMDEKAVEEYRTALSLKPDFAEAFFNLGIVYMDKGDMDMARRAFKSGLMISPHDRRAQQVLESIISGPRGQSQPGP